MSSTGQTLQRLRGAITRLENARHDRDELIRELAEAGMPQAEIARQAKLTRGRVWQIIRSGGKDADASRLRQNDNREI